MRLALQHTGIISRFPLLLVLDAVSRRSIFCEEGVPYES